MELWNSITNTQFSQNQEVEKEVKGKGSGEELKETQ